MLVGADYFWRVVSGKVQRITESLLAIESCFGWALQGPVTTSSVTDAEALSVTTTEESQRKSLSHAGINLCKWVTNSPDLRAKWTEGAVEHTTETDSRGNVLKLLGLVWRSEKDNFVFDLKGLLGILKGKENKEKCVKDISSYL